MRLHDKKDALLFPVEFQIEGFPLSEVSIRKTEDGKWVVRRPGVLAELEPFDDPVSAANKFLRYKPKPAKEDHWSCHTSP